MVYKKHCEILRNNQFSSQKNFATLPIKRLDKNGFIFFNIMDQNMFKTNIKHFPLTCQP